MNDLDEILRRPLDALMPHRDPMILLTRAAGMEDEAFVAEVDISEHSPFFEEGGVPAWIGLEYMAQTVGLFSGVEGALAGRDVLPGLLLGARTYSSGREQFFAGETLRIVARKVLQQDNGISAMECSIQDPTGMELAQAQLTVIQLPTMAALDEVSRP
ncbi:MAG TPA: 3-hydroxylacyl-ACP dehydratase [bacterium]|jgi:predicted hotdog family 3-hydroxylacyl-ACP dehydratase|nr:3-hydroxylacyl-ACP dehydratase [bacterium]